MTIGFGNGDFYRLHHHDWNRFSDEYLELYTAGGLAKALEFHCRSEQDLDYLIRATDLNLTPFDYISLHAPAHAYQKDENSRSLLDKLSLIAQKYSLKNIVFHVDLVRDWDVFLDYKLLPISIENMDDRKTSGRSLEDIKAILDKYDFNLTLDLQHCFVNDRSLRLAEQFQDEYPSKIVEYHLSGYDESLLHYPLFKTKQDQIINCLRYTDKPIIIESTFDKIGEHESELEYITQRLSRQ